ncbi:MAG: ABC transporter substrate-binding protein [Saprospiraceae bacterium]|nr:ABC transporter substrate-binding protein [Saprospiraceae bacterium]
MRKQTWFFLIFLAGILACTSKSEQQEPRYFTYNRFDGIPTLDPAFARNQATTWACHHLYNGLVQLENDLTLKPSIASAWQVSDDGLQYTFFLRDDVYFHDHELFESKAERKVTAEDVVFSFNRILDPEVASPGAWIFNNKVADKQPFIAVNDSTFQLNLKQPFNPILGILSMQYCSIVPKKIVTHYGKDFRNHPVGTGPFQFQLWEEGEVLLLNKNTDYFEKDNQDQHLPYLAGVRILFYVDKGLEYIKFMQGELDYISDLDPAFRNEMLTREGVLHSKLSQDIRLLKSPYLNTEYIGFLLNDATKAYSDKRIRLAINYGIDRKKMLTFIRNNIGSPATAGMVPVGMPNFDHAQIKGFDYNPEKAKALLEEAGYPGGQGLEPLVITTISNYADWAVSIQEQLAELGIPIKIEIVQSSFLREMMRKSDGLDLFRASWIADYTDPENYLSLFYGGNGAPPNYTRFQNDAFDALYLNAAGETNVNKRQEFYQQLDQIIVNEAPIIPLYYDEVLSFSHQNISGMFSHPMNILDLKRVAIED